MLRFVQSAKPLMSPASMYFHALSPVMSVVFGWMTSSFSSLEETFPNRKSDALLMYHHSLSVLRPVIKCRKVAHQFWITCICDGIIIIDEILLATALAVVVPRNSLAPCV